MEARIHRTVSQAVRTRINQRRPRPAHSRAGTDDWTLGAGSGNGKKSIEVLELQPERKRELVSELFDGEGYPIKAGCELLDLPRSSYYYPPVQADESAVEDAIDEIAGQFPTYGTRRVMHQLRRPPYEMQVNRKRVRRIMAQKGQLRPVKRSKKRTTDSEHPYPRYPNLVKELEITCPDQVWVSEIV